MIAHNLLEVFDVVCERARRAAQAYVHIKFDVDVLMCDFDGSILGYAGERNVR